MELEFQYNMQLAKARVGQDQEKEQFIENRKDERTRIQATQQSDLITQRQEGGSPRNFESTDNDQLTGKIGLSQFNPK